MGEAEVDEEDDQESEDEEYGAADGVDNGDEAPTEHLTYQSSRGCLPAVMFCGKDTNANAKLFLGDFFIWAEQLRSTGFYYRGIYFTVELVVPCDMKAHWQAGGFGGSSASTLQYCFLCTEQNTDKGGLIDACEDCRVRLNKQRCRHRPCSCSHAELLGKGLLPDIGDQPATGAAQFAPWVIPTYPSPAKADCKKVECVALLTAVGEDSSGDMVKVQRNALLWLREKRVVASGDPSAPHHVAVASRSLLEANLRLRFPGPELFALCEELVAYQPRMDHDERIEVTETEALRSLLAKCLKTEELLRIYCDRQGTRKETAFIDDVSCLVVDILHFENRVSEQLITRVVREGQQRPDLDGQGRKALITETENIINTRIFWSAGAGSGNYSINISNGGVDVMKMNNDRCGKVLQNIELLLDVSIVEQAQTRRTDFVNMCGLFRMFMCRLRSTEDYTDREIEVASDQMIDFGELWIKHFGTDSITNYVHYIVAGHIRYFLVLFKNLAIFANQGWEAMKGVMKKYLLRRTQAGGSKQGGCESVAKALHRYMQRLWLYFWDDTEFAAEGPLTRALMTFRDAKHHGRIVDVVQLMHVALHGEETEDSAESSRTSTESLSADDTLAKDLDGLAIYQASSTTGPSPTTEDSDFGEAT